VRFLIRLGRTAAILVFLVAVSGCALFLFPWRDREAPSPVVDLAAVPGDQSVVLTWVEEFAVDLAAIEITWTPNGSEGAELLDGAQEYVVIGLENGTSYTFTVVVRDTSGNRSTPESVEATPAPPDTAYSMITPQLRSVGATPDRRSPRHAVSQHVGVLRNAGLLRPRRLRGHPEDSPNAERVTSREPIRRSRSA
jgi:hypothetical protein